MSTLKELEPYVDSAIHVLFDKLNEMVGQTVDMGNWVQLYAFDVIGEVTFSKRFGFMDVGSDDGSFKQIENALQSAAWIGQVPWLYWLHDYLSPVIGTWLGIASRHGSLRKFAAREVAARQDRGSDHQDILGKLLAVHHDKPDQFDNSDLVSMATSNIFAGSDTTAISIRAIIYYMLKYPEAKRKLVEEVDTLWQQGKLSDPVTVAESEKMPYLQAAMYEALRLHPAVGMTLPRVVPKGGYEIDGRFMPAGLIPTLLLHFDIELVDPNALLEEKCQ
ncbi:Cytochrome P450 monooxygenase gsfF [Colletotrichum sp. SAR 10_98]|nr:Cytochrome P450 monooxygenase gsfF [Colletotrichum sp. SAR 10_98]